MLKYWFFELKLLHGCLAIVLIRLWVLTIWHSCGRELAYSSWTFCCLLFLSVNGLLVFQIFALKPAVHQAFLNFVPNKVVRPLNYFLLFTLIVKKVYLSNDWMRLSNYNFLYTLLKVCINSFFLDFWIPDDRKGFLDKIF